LPKDKESRIQGMKEILAVREKKLDALDNTYKSKPLIQGLRDIWNEEQ